MIQVNKMHKYFGDFHVLRNISLNVKHGEVVAILGPSGSGKSTFMRTLNRLEPFDKGDIFIDGVDIKSTLHSKQMQRQIGMVFQHFNLFPHLTILENIILSPIKVYKWPYSQCVQLGHALLDNVGIADQYNKFPSELSGGQQQRAAIARALVLDPKVMLFDEPTSALDPENVNDILQILKKLMLSGMTLVIVSHEIKIAQNIANRILFFDQGQIIEDTTPNMFFSNPQQKRTNDFLEKILY